MRLFRELEVRNRALTESLDQQTATSDILRVISSSPTDVQPVFAAVAESAARLCEAVDAAIWRREPDRLLLVAHHGAIRLGSIGEFSIPLVHATAGGRSVLDGQTVHLADAQAEAHEFHETSENARRMGFRTILSVPLMREGVAIGAIQLRRAENQPFADRQVALLQTFADQAAIAIENVRLFTQVQAQNRELTETVEQQTATSEILRAISASPTDVHPVFDMIARNARRLCAADSGAVFTYDGELVHLEALDNVGYAGADALRQAYPQPVTPGHATGRAILRGRPVHIEDAQADRDFNLTGVLGAGVRTVLAVPMMREGAAVGVIVLHTWSSPRPFSEGQIALLETFADQAVIAVENVRLFQELETRTGALTRSVGELRALGEVSQAVGSTLDLHAVLETIVDRAARLSGSDQGVIYEFDDASQTFHQRATHGMTAEYLQVMETAPIRVGEGAIGRAAITRQPVEVGDIQKDSQLVAAQAREQLIRQGMGSLLAVPLVREDRILGGLVIIRRQRGAFSPEVVALLQTFATQSVLAIHNAHLFLEIQRQKQYADSLVETSWTARSSAGPRARNGSSAIRPRRPWGAAWRSSSPRPSCATRWPPTSGTRSRASGSGLSAGAPARTAPWSTSRSPRCRCWSTGPRWG